MVERLRKREARQLENVEMKFWEVLSFAQELDCTGFTLLADKKTFAIETELENHFVSPCRPAECGCAFNLPGEFGLEPEKLEIWYDGKKVAQAFRTLTPAECGRLGGLVSKSRSQRKAGSSMSPAKQAAARENGKLGGRPPGAKDREPRKIKQAKSSEERLEYYKKLLEERDRMTIGRNND